LLDWELTAKSKATTDSQSTPISTQEHRIPNTTISLFNIFLMMFHYYPFPSDYGNLGQQMHTKLGKFSIKCFEVIEKKSGHVRKTLLEERVQMGTHKVFKEVNASTSRGKTESGLKQGLKRPAKPLDVAWGCTWNPCLGANKWCKVGFAPMISWVICHSKRCSGSGACWRERQ